MTVEEKEKWGFFDKDMDKYMAELDKAANKKDFTDIETKEGKNKAEYNVG